MPCQQMHLPCGVGVARGGVRCLSVSSSSGQPGRGRLGALWPAFSPLHRPFSLSKAHLFPIALLDSPGPPLAHAGPLPLTSALHVPPWVPCVDGGGTHKGALTLRKVLGPLAGPPECGTNSCCPPEWGPALDEHLDRGPCGLCRITGHFS